MTAVLEITRVGPLTTIQDKGRFGALRYGIGPSGPMDRDSYRRAGALAGGGEGAIEFTSSGIDLVVRSGGCWAGFAGGDFAVRHNGEPVQWPGRVELATGDLVSLTPGRWGNYGYLRFNKNIAVPPVLGSLATSSRVGLGGLNGRALQVGDQIELTGQGGAAGPIPDIIDHDDQAPIRFIWGIHAEHFSPPVRQRFVDTPFVISPAMDRMGVRLADPSAVFASVAALSLVSDATVAGDIQILGDGTPIVLMRDHQPTGGYPRIATVITADLDRFAQMRPGTAVAFAPVTVEHAQRLLRDR